VTHRIATALSKKSSCCSQGARRPLTISRAGFAERKSYGISKCVIPP
jgi:hypothetical protein